MSPSRSEDGWMQGARRIRRAFTLIELTLTLGVMAMLMAGLASAVVLASRALPDPNRPSSDVLEQSSVVDRIAGDLQYARYITERGAHAVTFTVADRNGDGSPECLRYAWSGTAGDRSARQRATIRSDVQHAERRRVI